MTSISRLSSGEPGTTTAPLSPPARSPAASTSASPAWIRSGIGAVTLVAALGEDRTDLRFEVLEVFGEDVLRTRRPGDAGGQHEESAQQAGPDRGFSTRQRPKMCVHH